MGNIRNNFPPSISFEPRLLSGRLRYVRLSVLLVVLIGLMTFAGIAQDDKEVDRPTPRPALPLSGDAVEPVTTKVVIPPINVVPKNVERAEEVLPYLRIGYIKPAVESAMNRDWYLGLEDALMSDQAFRSKVNALGIKGVVLRPCDDAEDMYKRLGLMEFDVAYAPAMVYARHRLAKPGEYNAVFMLQSREPREGSLEPRGNERPNAMTRRRGALFVSAASASADTVTSRNKERIRSFLTEEQTVFGVSGTYDVAGYLYGLKLIDKELDNAQPGQLIYYGSPQEVVKAVITGLADVGVCEEEVLEEVLNSIPNVRKNNSIELNRFVRVYNKRTEWIPTDPVIFRRAYTEYGKGAELGEEIKRVLDRYHKLSTTEAPILKESRDFYYNDMLKDILNEKDGQ